MAAGVDSVFTSPGLLQFVYNGSTAAHTLPYTFFFEDLIPNSMRWLPEGGTAGNAVVITDGQGNRVYEEWCSAANSDPFEQRPRGKQKWLAASATDLHAGLHITVFDAGRLYIWY